MRDMHVAAPHALFGQSSLGFLAIHLSAYAVIYTMTIQHGRRGIKDSCFLVCVAD